MGFHNRRFPSRETCTGQTADARHKAEAPGPCPGLLDSLARDQDLSRSVPGNDRRFSDCAEFEVEAGLENALALVDVEVRDYTRQRRQRQTYISGAEVV